jgi:MoaA/NifB/PqqE/SkfB family radical SAM enzyme
MFDRRMYAIFDYVAAKLPKTGIGHFTNGTTLRPKNIDRLCALPNLGFINVSLNSHQPKEHTRLMGLKFELVLENLMALHQAFEKRSQFTSPGLAMGRSGTSISWLGAA